MKKNTKEELIEAARQLFWEKGYGATGIAEILTKANVGSGSLYYFFPTKEDLLLAVLDWYKNNLYAMVIDPVYDRISDPVERVFGIMDGYRRQLLASDFYHGCPVGSLALELANSHPQARKVIAANFIGWKEAVEKCLQDASGRFPREISLSDLALFILNTMEGAVMLARTFRQIEPYDVAVTLLRDYLERLLRDGSLWSHSPAPPDKSKG